MSTAPVPRAILSCVVVPKEITSSVPVPKAILSSVPLPRAILTTIPVSLRTKSDPELLAGDAVVYLLLKQVLHPT